MKSTLTLDLTIYHERNLTADAQGLTDLTARLLTTYLGQHDPVLSATAKLRSACLERWVAMTGEAVHNE